MTGIVDVVLVGGDTHLHVFHLLHTVPVVGEGDQGLGVIGQARDSQGVLPLLVGSRHGQIHLHVALGIRALVLHQRAHHAAHRIFGRSLAGSVNLGDSHVVVEEVPHADTVHIDVVALLRSGVKSDVDAFLRGIIRQVKRIQLPYRRGRRLQITFDGGGCLALRNQIGISVATVGGNLHGHFIILVGSGVVMREPQLQFRVHRPCQSHHRQDGARNRVAREILGVEEQTARAVNRRDGGVHARALLEGPVAGTGNLLECPHLLRSVAEVLLVVGDYRFHGEHLGQGVVAVVDIARSGDGNTEIYLLVHRHAHVFRQDYVHAAQCRKGTRVQIEVLVQVQGGGVKMDDCRIPCKIDRMSTFVGDFDRNVIRGLGAFALNWADQGGDGSVNR